jgi:hypothetical protein
MDKHKIRAGDNGFTTASQIVLEASPGAPQGTRVNIWASKLVDAGNIDSFAELVEQK